MAKGGKTKISWSQAYFDNLLKTAEVDSLSRAQAEKVLATAKATAPVSKGPKGGAYRAGLRIREIETPYRRIFIVEGTVPYTLKVESRTGNLARALKSARG